MTYQLTRKQSAIVEALQKQGTVYGVYELARLLNRPHNRVSDNLATLKDAGIVELVEGARNNRRVTVIRIKSKEGGGRPNQPALSHNRAWSSPISGVNDNTLIAGVLAEPSFNDLLSCCLHYGVKQVRQIYLRMVKADELRPLVQKSVGRILANIEIGIARAA